MTHVRPRFRSTALHLDGLDWESIFEVGGNRSAQRKLSKPGWDRLKLTYNICSTGGRRDWWPLRQPDFPKSTEQWIYPDGHPSRNQLRLTGFNFGAQTGTGVSLLLITVLFFHLFFLISLIDRSLEFTLLTCFQTENKWPTQLEPNLLIIN